METARSWNKKGPKISEDVSSKKGLDRSHHYRAGVLLDSGLMLSGNRASNISDPGPGYYDPVSKTDIAYTTNKEHARGANFGRPNNSSTPSPDKAQNNSIHTSMIKDDLLINLVGVNNSNIGPGSYDVPCSSFEVKSFNHRVNKSLQKRQQTRSPKGRSPGDEKNPQKHLSFQGVPLKYASP